MKRLIMDSGAGWTMRQNIISSAYIRKHSIIERIINNNFTFFISWKYAFALKTCSYVFTSLDVEALPPVSWAAAALPTHVTTLERQSDIQIMLSNKKTECYLVLRDLISASACTGEETAGGVEANTSDKYLPRFNHSLLIHVLISKL